MDYSTYDFTKLKYRTQIQLDEREENEAGSKLPVNKNENTRPLNGALNSPQSSVKRRVTIHEPPREGNRSDRQETLQRLQSLRRRRAVQELLKSFANSSGKTEREKAELMERAFTWVRDQLTELREQDKDIMRMFTRIQAGIRQLKAERTVSEGSDVSVEEEAVPDRQFLAVPFAKTSSEPPRRMSVV